MIRVFADSTADLVWQQLAQAFRESDGVHSQPGRGGTTKEILHVAISIQDPTQRWVVSRQPPLNLAFALAEVIWIMRGRRDLAFLRFWNHRLCEFVGPGPELHGAYGYRLRRHLNVDQLERAYRALDAKPDGRQVVLQIWDSGIDLPNSNGTPVDEDVPCNVVAMLKLRDRELEWTQVMRSNDLFLGITHNVVQFTSLQEIMAGWLGVPCGSYNHFSDSLHLYDRDVKHIANSSPITECAQNTDSLAVSFQESELVFSELESRVERLIDKDSGTSKMRDLGGWTDAPESYQNILRVLVAEAIRKRGDKVQSMQVMESCTNPAYAQMWSRWMSRMSS